MRLLRVIRAVLWGFFGVRRRGDAARDLEEAGPGTMILAGLIGAAILVGGIVALVRFVAADRAASPATQAPEASRAAPPKPHGPVVVADTMEERARPCSTCHGAETQSTKEGFSPRIAGKPAGYLFNQLASFRDGRRGYPPMVYLVQYMSDDYLREMAEHFAKLDLP
jgi:cytochrome c553